MIGAMKETAMQGTPHLTLRDLDHLDQFAVVEATLQPARMHTLRPQSAPFVGVRTRFERMWPIEAEGSTTYAGQSAWRVLTPDGEGLHPGIPWWVPTEDLVEAVLIEP